HFHVENLQIHKNSTHQELMIWDLHVMLAKSYVNSLKENVNRSIAQKLRNGEWISTAPLGYKHIKAGPRDRGMGKIVVDEDRAPLVRKLFEEYATGAYTLGEMVKKSKEWGLTNQYGNKGFLSRSQIHRMIQNPFYYGMMLYRKKNKTFPHKYPPLISKAVYDQCQAVRKGWNKKPFKYAGKDFLFRGLVRCATTGRLGTAQTKKKKYLNGGTGEWTYLRVWNPDNPEKHMLVREEKVLDQVEDVFKALELSPEDLAEVVDYIKSSADNQQDYHERRLEELHKELITVKRRISRLTDLFVDGDIDKDTHEERRAELIKERDDIMFEIEQSNTADDNFTNTLIGTVEVASGAYDTFKVGTFEQKRRLLNFVFDHLELKGSTLCYSLKKPFDRFVDLSKIEEWRAREDSNL
ncbi:MAG: recombinase family protein, partial [Alphaproteobacteria bacterium]|nr:recombinase family protein [Alphaproteobacteria bacterium]